MYQNLNAYRSTPSKRVLSRREEYGIAVYYACGMPIARISEHFTISRSGVHRVLDRLGVEKGRYQS